MMLMYTKRSESEITFHQRAEYLDTVRSDCVPVLATKRANGKDWAKRRRNAPVAKHDFQTA